MKNDCCSQLSVGEKAGKYFQNGYHCAEAVASAVLEDRDIDPRQAVAHATPFGGGMGRTFCETCGAISGGLIAIGHVHGRREIGENWDKPAAMGEALRNAFVKEYDVTDCGVLRERFGEEQSIQCTRIVEVMAAATVDVLADSE